MAALPVDEGIGRDLVQALVAQGFTAHHWLEVGPKGVSDAVIFLTAQQRALTVFTYNRNDYVLLATAWHSWGHDDHHGLIARPKRTPQLSPRHTLQAMARYCADTSSFIDRIEPF